MVFYHPLCLGLSLAAAFLTLSALGGGQRIRWLLPLVVLTGAMNPLFNHRGATILFYLWNGNPVTWESIAYGLAAALLLLAVLVWCLCFHRVMTGDKLVHLFGSLSPTLALFLSMVFRLFPRLKQGFTAVAQNRRGKNPFGTLSVFVTWALEDTAETASALKARGYGTGERTSYSPYRWSRRDTRMLCALLLSGGITLWGVCTGAFAVSFYPTITGIRPNHPSYFLGYGIYLLLPLGSILWERYQWKSLQSKI